MSDTPETATDWREALTLLHEAYSANTIRGYRSDFAHFESWCLEQGKCPLPATPELVAEYVRAFTEDSAPATNRRRITAIMRIHRVCGFPDPTKAEIVYLSLRRMHRLKGRRQRQAHGLRAKLRDRLLSTCGDSLRGLRDRAIIMVGYDTLCRRAELVALRIEDIERLDDDAASILVRRSKSDALGEGKLAYLSPETTTTLTAWLNAAGLEDGPIFRRIWRSGKVGTAALNPYSITRLLKEKAKAASLEPQVIEKLSGHSFRIGAAVDMVEHGVDLLPIMQAGRWKSPAMVLRYTEQVDVTKSGAAQLHHLAQHERAAFARAIR